MPGLSICLAILHAWQAFEDTSGYKYARVLNMAQLFVYASVRRNSENVWI